MNVIALHLPLIQKANAKFLNRMQKATKLSNPGIFATHQWSVKAKAEKRRRAKNPSSNFFEKKTEKRSERFIQGLF
jgi:hypothetical protein